MVTVKEDLSHLFTLNAAFDNGDIISMMADRVFGSQKTVDCQFLSKTAHFPAGPFSLAVKKKAPVLAVFVMKEGFKKYRIIIKRIPYDTSAEKEKQITELAQNFVSMLEEILRQYPTQWFNYYDFWKQ
jgi:predicted LPLAT superfamily acyltransferase